MTDEQQQWAEAMVRAWEKMPPIPKTHKAKIKTKTGADYEYTYADLPDIIDAVRPILAAEGLAALQSVESIGNDMVGVVTRIYHKAGWVESFGPTPMPAAGDPRSIGSAITYARRYALSAALGIASDEDTDAGGTETRQKATRTAQAAPGGTDAAKLVGDAQAKKAARAAVLAAHPDLSQEEAMRLVLAHWHEATAAEGLFSEALLRLVAADLGAKP